MSNSKSISYTLKNVEERGLKKLNEVPSLLRDMADEIERRVERTNTLHDANHAVTVQLRLLDSCLGILRESASSAIADHAKVVALALKESE